MTEPMALDAKALEAAAREICAARRIRPDIYDPRMNVIRAWPRIIVGNAWGRVAAYPFCKGNCQPHRRDLMVPVFWPDTMVVLDQFANGNVRGAA